MAPASPGSAAGSSAPSSPAHRSNAGSPVKFEPESSLDEGDDEESLEDASSLEALAAPLDLTFEEKLALAVKDLKPKKVAATVVKVYDQKGKKKLIKVKKRVMSVKERAQLEKQRLKREAASNANAPPPDIPHQVLDLESPDQKLQRAKSKLMKLASLNQGLGANKLRLQALAAAADKPAEAEEEEEEEEEKEDGKMHLWDIVFGAKTKAKSDAYMAAVREMEMDNNRKPGLRDWPPWLVEYTKPRMTQARNARLLHKLTVKTAQDPDKEDELKVLKEKKERLTLPKIK
jgi:hypothetical protein